MSFWHFDFRHEFLTHGEMELTVDAGPFAHGGRQTNDYLEFKSRRQGLLYISDLQAIRDRN